MENNQMNDLENDLNNMGTWKERKIISVKNILLFVGIAILALGILTGDNVRDNLTIVCMIGLIVITFKLMTKSMRWGAHNTFGNKVLSIVITIFLFVINIFMIAMVAMYFVIESVCGSFGIL